MEEYRLLDIPTSRDDSQVQSSSTRHLSPDNTTSDRYSNEGFSNITRFRSLRSSTRQIHDEQRNHAFENLDTFQDRISARRLYDERNHAFENLDPFQDRIPTPFKGQPRQRIDFEQPTTYSRQAAYSRLEYPPDLWEPFWLRKSTLAMLLTLWLLTIVGIILLWHFSDVFDGYDYNSSVSYYAWRCTPVIVIIIFIGLWRQVDYYFKLLAPWDELRKGPSPASRGLLVDYITPVDIVSLLRAVENGCISVIISISILFLLKILTIFSAALLVRLPTSTTFNSTVAVTRAFDASSFSILSPDSSRYSANPVYATLGNIIYGLPYEIGVTPDYAYVPVSLPSNMTESISNVTYSVSTDLLYPTLDCSTPGLTMNFSQDTLLGDTRGTSDIVTVQLKGDESCKNWAPFDISVKNPSREIINTQYPNGTMRPVYCRDESQPGRSSSEPTGLFFGIFDVRYRQSLFPNGTIANSSRSLIRWSAAFCTSRYSMFTAAMTNKSSLAGDNSFDILGSSTTRAPLEGFSAQNLPTLYEGVMNESSKVFDLQDNRTLDIPNTVFQLMWIVANPAHSGGVPNYDYFFDSYNIYLAKAAEMTFRRVMSHYLAQVLVKPTQSSTTVSVTYTKDRLHVNQASFYVLLAGFALIALGVMVLWLMTPGAIIPRNPSSIATMAAVLTSSAELNHLLKKHSSERTDLIDTMSEHQYGTAIATNELGQSSFKIVVSEGPFHFNLSRRRDMHRWWNPNTLLIPALGLTIAIPVALICILEYLQRTSDANAGLGSIPMTWHAPLSITCIPVLVVLLAASTIEFLDFHVQLFSPWKKLHKGAANPQSSLMSHLLGRLPPIALIKAFSENHSGAIFSILAATIASILAIFAAGLYHIDVVPIVQAEQQVNAVDTFSFPGQYTVYNDTGAAGILRYVETNRVPYPSGTFENLVFSNYSTASLQNSSSSSFYMATLPAIRPSLQCNFISQEKRTVSYIKDTSGVSRWFINSTYDLPLGCPTGRRDGNVSNAYLVNNFTAIQNTTSLYGGQLLDLVYGAGSNMTKTYGESYTNVVPDNLPVGCPSLSFTFVHIRGDIALFNITTMICYQQLQRIKANVTYGPNSTQLDSSYPPLVDEKNMSLIENPLAATSVTSFDWRIQANVERQLFGLDPTKRFESMDLDSKYQFDAFFSYLISMSSNQDPNILAGPQNEQRLLNETQFLYGRYMAQAISGNMRLRADAVTRRPKAFNSTAVMRNVILTPRLVQDSKGKLALQILLGSCALLCILAYGLTSFRHILPVNPCSIASVMSLLAGSDLCRVSDDALYNSSGRIRRTSWSGERRTDASAEDTIRADPSEYHVSSNASVSTAAPHHDSIIPIGAEWLDHRRFSAVFAGRAYSLGWWKEDLSKGRRRRYGVDVGPRPDDEEDKDWKLGRRKSLKTEHGFEGFMQRGRDVMGDRRGRYQRADRTEDGSETGRGVMLGSRSSRADDRSVSPLPESGVTSPRRVRFEDDF